MRRGIKFLILGITIWLITFYSYAAAIISWPHDDNPTKRISGYSSNYWSPNPSLIKSEGGWDSKVWKWHEFLGCGSTQLINSDHYNYTNWPKDHEVQMSMLTKPELDWVYVAGISVGSVWNDLEPTYQPVPLKVSQVDSLILETSVDEWRGTPLSPAVFPSWYAVLTDLWFNVTDVTIEDEKGSINLPSKILGIDIFYHTMTGSLNTVMGASGEFARIEPCNENFIYSVNLAEQDYYSHNDGVFVVNLFPLLFAAQKEAEKQGWYFDIDNVELVMLESVIESYWSYAYAEISWTGIRFCSDEEKCAV